MDSQNDLTIIDGRDTIGTLLATRWAWTGSDNPTINKTYALLTKLGAALVAMADESARLKSSGRLTKAGVDEALHDFISSNFAPAYRAADYDGRRGLERAIETARAQGVDPIDKTDAAGAVLRSDLRRMFFAMPDPQRAAILARPVAGTMPAALATAILELPPEIHGLDADKEAALREAAFGNRFPDQARLIAELAEVRAFTIAALELAAGKVMNAIGANFYHFNELVWGGQPGDEAAA